MLINVRAVETGIVRELGTPGAGQARTGLLILDLWVTKGCLQGLRMAA